MPMTPQKVKKESSSAAAAAAAAAARKPRRSIKAEGNCLNTMLRQGVAKVIDASKLGKRLSSDIWSSFGAIQVEDNFAYPSIETKTVADGTATLRICNFFVACSRCFSVFKYDGHAYGTTGLVKHVKICQGANKFLKANQLNNTIDHNNHTLTTAPTSDSIITNGPVLNSGGTGSTIVFSTNQITSNNLPQQQALLLVKAPATRRRAPAARGKAPTAALRHLTKLVEEIRTEQEDMKQKIQDLITAVSNASWQVGQIQIITDEDNNKNDGLVNQPERNVTVTATVTPAVTTNSTNSPLTT